MTYSANDRRLPSASNSFAECRVGRRIQPSEWGQIALEHYFSLKCGRSRELPTRHSALELKALCKRFVEAFR